MIFYFKINSYNLSNSNRTMAYVKVKSPEKIHWENSIVIDFKREFNLEESVSFEGIVNLSSTNKQVKSWFMERRDKFHTLQNVKDVFGDLDIDPAMFAELELSRKLLSNASREYSNAMKMASDTYNESQKTAWRQFVNVSENTRPLARISQLTVENLPLKTQIDLLNRKALVVSKEDKEMYQRYVSEILKARKHSLATRLLAGEKLTNSDYNPE
jgi:hypothetical protein